MLVQELMPILEVMFSQVLSKTEKVRIMQWVFHKAEIIQFLKYKIMAHIPPCVYVSRDVEMLLLLQNDIYRSYDLKLDLLNTFTTITLF